MNAIMTSFKLKDGTTVDGALQSKIWVASGFEPATIEYAEEFGRWLAGQGENVIVEKETLTTSQIRNIYGEVVRLKMQGWGKETEHSLLLLKARLAYATEKPPAKIGPKSFRKVMEPALDAIFGGEDEDKKFARFMRFADFFESVLAYHRINDKKSNSQPFTQRS